MRHGYRSLTPPPPPPLLYTYNNCLGYYTNVAPPLQSALINPPVSQLHPLCPNPVVPKCSLKSSLPFSLAATPLTVIWAACHRHSPFLLPQLPLTVLLFLLLLLLPLCFFFFFFCFLVFRFSVVCNRLSHDQQAWSEALCCSSPSSCPSSSLPASSSLLQLLCIPAMLAVLFLLCASSIMVSCRSSGVQQYLCRPACLPCFLACLLALLLACLPRLSRLPP